MCRLFSCIPIFKGLFLIKNRKKMCIYDYVKNRIVTCENLCFGGKKRYKQISVPGSCKANC